MSTETEWYAINSACEKQATLNLGGTPDLAGFDDLCKGFIAGVVVAIAGDDEGVARNVASTIATGARTKARDQVGQPTWRNTLSQPASKFAGETLQTKAKELGYVFYEFNSKVMTTEGAWDTGWTVDDLR